MEAQKTINQHKDLAAKKQWRKHFRKKEQTALEEACMHNVAGVSEIAWIPAGLNNPFQKDKSTEKLLGKYVFKVWKLDQMINNDYANCPTFEVHPNSSWVESSILPQYLATAQRIACDFFQQIVPDGQRYDKQGYVDVSCSE